MKNNTSDKVSLRFIPEFWRRAEMRKINIFLDQNFSIIRSLLPCIAPSLGILAILRVRKNTNSIVFLHIYLLKGLFTFFCQQLAISALSGYKFCFKDHKALVSIVSGITNKWIHLFPVSMFIDHQASLYFQVVFLL